MGEAKCKLKDILDFAEDVENENPQYQKMTVIVVTVIEPYQHN